MIDSLDDSTCTDNVLDESFIGCVGQSTNVLGQAASITGRRGDLVSLRLKSRWQLRTVHPV